MNEDRLDIDYQRIVEVLQAENEHLREKIAKARLSTLNLATFFVLIRHIMSNTYFQIGVVVGCVLTAIGGFLWDR